MHRPVVIFFALLVLAVSALANQPITVGGVTAAPGERVSGWLEVAKGIDEGTRLPLTVVNGKSDGPVLALIAGIHGYEYAGIVALQRVANRIDPQVLRGAVIVVPIANPPAFYGRRVYYGLDGKNLNRVFPGDPKGTLSDRIADALTHEVIGRATCLIDLHGGDGNESLRPYTYWTRRGDPEIDEASKQLALAYGFDRIVIDDERPAVPGKTLYAQTTAVWRGVPAITAEAGAAGSTDASSVDAHLAGIFSVLHHLGMMPSAADRSVEHPLFIRNLEVLRSTKTGLWEPAVESQQQVAKGTLFGRVLDPFGNVIEEVRAPFAGQVIYIVVTPPATSGEPLGAVAAFLREGEAIPAPPRRN